jgi:hypothetical protein
MERQELLRYCQLNDCPLLPLTMQQSLGSVEALGD